MDLDDLICILFIASLSVILFTCIAYILLMPVFIVFELFNMNGMIVWNIMESITVIILIMGGIMLFWAFVLHLMFGGNS